MIYISCWFFKTQEEFVCDAVTVINPIAEETWFISSSEEVGFVSCDMKIPIDQNNKTLLRKQIK